jgi:hypothetical protein
MPNELYRFVQLRGAVPAPVDDDLLIYAWSEPPSDFEKLLIGPGDPAAIAETFLDDPAPREAMNGLRRLDAAMTGSTDTVTVEGLRDAVRKFMDVEDVVNRARVAAQDMLAAVIIAPNVTFAGRNAVHRLVVLAAASQKALRWGGGEAAGEERRRQNQALRNILARGRAVLSPRVSRLLGPGPAAAPPGTGRARDGGGAPPARPDPLERRRRRDAALNELIAIATDPTVDRVVVPAIGRQPDEVAPRLRLISEISLRPPRVLLQGAVRDRLSVETRTLVDPVRPTSWR